MQAAVSAILVIWSAYMAIRCLVGGYSPLCWICFGAMAVAGYWFMLRTSLQEIKDELEG